MKKNLAESQPGKKSECPALPHPHSWFFNPPPSHFPLLICSYLSPTSPPSHFLLLLTCPLLFLIPPFLPSLTIPLTAELLNQTSLTSPLSVWEGEGGGGGNFYTDDSIGVFVPYTYILYTGTQESRRFRSILKGTLAWDFLCLVFCMNL